MIEQDQATTLESLAHSGSYFGVDQECNVIVTRDGEAVTAKFSLTHRRP